MRDDSPQEPLAPDEEILWTGQPYGGFYFDPRGIFPAVFGVFFLLFMATMATIMLTRPKPMPLDEIVFITLWSLGVGSIALYLIVGRFWLDARRRKRIQYTVTNQRIIIRSGLVVPKKTVIDIASMNNLSWESTTKGRGHALLAPRSEAIAFWFHPGMNPWFLGLGIPALELIDEPERLFNLIRSARIGILSRIHPQAVIVE